MKNRFITSVVTTAKEEHVVLPWQRGVRRKAFIAKRLAEDTLKLSA